MGLHNSLVAYNKNVKWEYEIVYVYRITVLPKLEDQCVCTSAPEVHDCHYFVTSTVDYCNFAVVFT